MSEPEEPARDEGSPPGGEHVDTGLDLARTIARAMAGSRPGRRPAGRGRSGTRARRADPAASGARPDERDPQLLDTTIDRLIDDQGWSSDVRVHGVFSRWDHLVGEEVAAHCFPVSFTDGKLSVRTDSTAWATQMRLLASTVVARLNEELGEGTVRLVEVSGPSAPSWRKGRRSVRDGIGPRDTYG